MTLADYQGLASPQGGLFVGSPQQIIDKLLYQHELFGHQRFMGPIDVGGMPFAKVAEMIELLGSAVAPVVGRETAARPTAK
jgi:alkanesulfonate monooxygenase SsuD/methylene tetrahydromethanopterin reductase-like flavin-dependent oxidoreductase (luciferase family)